MTHTERRIERHSTTWPDPRRRVTLDISDRALEALQQAGMEAQRVSLEAHEDDLPGQIYYTLHAWGPLSEERARGVKPAVDKLVELVNRFAVVIDAEDQEGKISPAVVEAWHRVVDEWDEYGRSGEETAPEPELANRKGIGVEARGEAV
jgi:hypothetical protein